MRSVFKRVAALGLAIGAISLAGIALNTASVKAAGMENNDAASKTVSEVNKVELKRVLDIANEKEEADYTKASWKGMDSAKMAAVIKFNDRGATQIAVDNAVNELNNAISWLVPATSIADKAALSTALQDAKKLASNDYTAGSWNAVDSAYNDALAVFNDAHSDQEAVNNALAVLNHAVDALVKKSDTSGKANKTELQKAVEGAVALKEADYSKDSWKAMVTVCDAANKVMKDEAATQESVDKALKDLNKAVLELSGSSLDVDKTALSKQLQGADALNEKDYTQESWKAMRSVYLNTVIVFQNRNALQPEVDTAVAALQKAIADLIKNPQSDEGTYTVISNDKYGVEVRGQLDKGTSLNVQPVNLKVLENRITDKAFLSKAILEKAFDIDLTKDNTKAKLNGEAEVSIHIDPALSKKKLDVIYIDEKGNIQIMPSSVKGEVITFKTTHFSTYAIVSYKNTPTAAKTAATTVTSNKNAAVQTGDETNSMLYIVLTFVAGVSVPVCIYRKVKFR